MRYLGEAEARKGAPSGARDKGGVRHLSRGTPATGKPPRAGLPEQEGPRSPHRAPEPESATQHRAVGFLLLRPPRRLGLRIGSAWGGETNSSSYSLSRNSTAEELSFLPGSFTPTSTCRRVLRETGGRRSLDYRPSLPHPLVGALW